MSNLSEEEKKAIDYYINNEYSFGFETDMDIESFKKAIGIEETDEDTWEKHQIRFKTLLNLIEKQQKELEQEKEKNKELEATLKQTQDSWYEDTKKIELNNECEIALNNRIIDLENELNKEKEKNKKQEKQIEKLLNIKLYACDENKNKECNKKHCYINGGECDRTTDITKVKYINLDEYISKDKIRERIEQKRDYIDKELQKANSSSDEEIKERLWCASAMLEELEQELLEE